MYRSDISGCMVRRAAVPTSSEPPRRAARVRGPRPAPRRPPARLRAAQAAHHRARHLPGAVLRLALPGAAPLRRRGLDPRDRRGAATGTAASAPRITYELTADGKEHFQDLVAASGPRRLGRRRLRRPLRLLLPHRGRRSGCASSRAGARRLEERLANIRDASQARRERMDSYTLALQRHGEERAEREVRWLDGAHRRRAPRGPDPGPAARHPAPPRHRPHPQSTTTNNKE